MTDPERYVVTLPISAAAADVAGAPASFIERYVRSVGYPDGAQFSTNLDAASDLTAMKAELEEVKKERDALRVIISECATATGAGVAPHCSLDFMRQLPAEIRLGREAAEQERDEPREALNLAAINRATEPSNGGTA